MTTFGFATVLDEDGGDGPVLSVMADDRILPLHDLVSEEERPTPVPDTFDALLDRWDAWVDTVLRALRTYPPDDAGRPWRAASEVTFLPPTAYRPTVYCAGANYRDHVAEMGAVPPDPATARPFHFLVPGAALSGHRGESPRPPGMRRLDWEAELAAVIGRRADSVSVEEALDYVAGYTVANDLSCRDDEALSAPPFGIHWLLQKGWRGLKPLGPAVVPASLVPTPHDLPIRLSVNGEVRQNSNTNQMIFSLAEQISALSKLAPLHPGDLLLSGTPAGTAAAHQGRYLEPGDEVVVEVVGVGRLETRVTGS
ncbi:FAA hydrolase family protein [Streptomyces sp. SID8382]|uniref:fumarylacetoacetate hydrolase family protein n=1 Tax=Streptomyces malaysiensis TaxID=92644 RepID=UPI000C2C3F3F|nr:fumarylacetoacetate hydrolase family protein [Streptomyces sp. M56]AUA12427.1 Homoprotocatechuate catabolism bifunctional isomerase/decarboxylase [Streptomyces sp. M56]MYX58238.1 FAA hydrolase family protein [Streptomyces sp. SID8382]